MSVYRGGRIVPKHFGVWNSETEYEMLAIVLEEDTGDSYISRKTVPAGTLLSDEEYWALCARFSDQLQTYQEETDARLEALEDETSKAIDSSSSASEKLIAETKEELQGNIDKLSEELEKSKKSNPLYGKKLVGIGDYMMSDWLQKIADRNSMTATSYGDYDYRLSDIAEKYSEMEDADYILVFAGSVDIGLGVDIGDEDSEDPSDFYGALNSLCQGLLCKYPQGKIAFITPYVTDREESAETKAYVDAIETACRNNGGIPVFNNISSGGLCYWNEAQAEKLISDDGSTYSDEGNEWASWKYEAFMRTL
ncbi:MAG: SGNH/GDSL hydrolase family protein [Oscillospiraceae bacterium]|nr:SGNH/GDSL hydrolase family protein [Oscillospiraceae bacterium]